MFAAIALNPSNAGTIYNYVSDLTPLFKFTSATMSLTAIENPVSTGTTIAVKTLSAYVAAA